MNKSLKKRNIVITFNIVYLVVSVGIIADKLLKQMFDASPSTLAPAFLSKNLMDRLTYIANAYYDMILWFCVLSFILLLSDIIIYYNERADYKRILPLNAVTILVNTLIALYFGINHYIFIESLDTGSILIQQDAIVNSYVHNFLAVHMILFIAVGVNMIFWFAVKRKKTTSIKTALIGMTFSSLPMLIILISTLLPILQMQNMTA